MSLEESNGSKNSSGSMIDGFELFDLEQDKVKQALK